jgi:NDP-sugar pyrophosphorylase family protein
MLNIVVPMAGLGSRFTAAGYDQPKPFIPVHGKPMVEVVIDNLAPAIPHRWIFICRTEHNAEFGFESFLWKKLTNFELICIDTVTKGAACTVLLAKHVIDSAESLMIVNSDQWVDCNIDDYLATMNRQALDGLIMTMWADDPKWSFVTRDATTGLVTRVVEKEVISNEATVGIYNFASGAAFIDAAEEMIAHDLSVNGEFYVAPVFSILIGRGQRIGVYDVGRGMHGLGTPTDLEQFLRIDALAARIRQQVSRHIPLIPTP